MPPYPHHLLLEILLKVIELRLYEMLEMFADISNELFGARGACCHKLVRFVECVLKFAGLSITSFGVEVCL